jgi:integrase
VELEDPSALIVAQHGEASLASLIRWYIDDFHKLSRWRRTKQSQLEFLEKHSIGKANAVKLTVTALVDHIRARRVAGAAPSTAGNDLTWIGVVLRAAKSVKNVPVRPEVVDEARSACSALRLIGKSRQRNRTPTYEELEKLDAYFRRTDRSAKIPLRHIMWFAIYSTRREDEITRIQRSDNDADRKLGVVRDAKHPREKEGNHRQFRYTPEAWAIMEMQPAIENDDRIFPYNPKTIGSRFTRACRVLGILDLHFHDLRHEGTTRLFELGLQIPEVACHTLHESWAVLKRYTHLIKRSKLLHAPFLRESAIASRQSTARGQQRSRAKATSALPA